MEYLADTVAIIRHFSRTGKIGKKALEILKDADAGINTIWISTVSLAEIMYLAERKRIDLILEKFLDTIDNLLNYKIVDLNKEHY